VLKIFDTDDEARAGLDNDPEDVAFKHERGPLIPAGTAEHHGEPVATN
jgi:hypothetical protein